MKTNNVLHAIAALNLEPIKNKLMDAEHGEGWSRAKVEAMDLEYRRFLHLMYTFPNEPASPTKAVDTFWHYHILDTQKYVVDCDEVFGCFLHHNPYGDEASANTGVSSDERMQQLYEATFGEAYIRAEAYCLDQPEGATAGSAGRCQTVCMMGAKSAAAAEAAGSSRCQTVCMMGAMPARKPEAAASSRCQTVCMMGAMPARKPEAAASSRCQTVCMMGAMPARKPEAASSSRCQTVCMMGAMPARKPEAASSSRCQTVCMMGAMPGRPAEAAASSRCQTVCMMGAMPAAVAGAARDVRRSQTTAA